jgi:hypothetical protein
MAKGRDGRFMTGYFPLGESLLQHLRETDPRRGAIERMAKKADEANDRLMAERQRKLSSDIDAITREEFPRMFGIQSVGWTKHA